MGGLLKGFFNRQYEYKEAVKPTSLKIENGQIVGLVGANGAGKTTLLKMLSGLIYPSAGEVSVLGFKPWERKADFLRQISILLRSESSALVGFARRRQFQFVGGHLQSGSGSGQEVCSNSPEKLPVFRMQLHIQLRRLSLGERMKMEIIGSLLHRPKVLFLDEPTIGLDVLAQNTIREFLDTYVAENQPTIILTSHYMDDISRLADRLLLISRGDIVYDGTVENFVHHAEAHLNLNVNAL